MSGLSSLDLLAIGGAVLVVLGLIGLTVVAPVIGFASVAVVGLLVLSTAVGIHLRRPEP